MRIRKRTRVRICRMLLLAMILTGTACAGIAGHLIVQNAFHGFERLPQLAGTLAACGAMGKLAEWLAEAV